MCYNVPFSVLQSPDQPAPAAPVITSPTQRTQRGRLRKIEIERVPLASLLIKPSPCPHSLFLSPIPGPRVFAGSQLHANGVCVYVQCVSRCVLYVFVCASVCICVSDCVRECVSVCMCAFECVFVLVYAIHRLRLLLYKHSCFPFCLDCYGVYYGVCLCSGIGRQ